MKKITLPDELIFIKNRNAIQKRSTASMKGKHCVLTGATSGVGLSALKHIARGGASIMMVCRNSEKAETVRDEIMGLYNIPIDITIANLSSLDEVREAADSIKVRCPSLELAFVLFSRQFTS